MRLYKMYVPRLRKRMNRQIRVFVYTNTHKEIMLGLRKQRYLKLITKMQHF